MYATTMFALLCKLIRNQSLPDQLTTSASAQEPAQAMMTCRGNHVFGEPQALHLHLQLKEQGEGS